MGSNPMVITLVQQGVASASGPYKGTLKPADDGKYAECNAPGAESELRDVGQSLRGKRTKGGRTEISLGRWLAAVGPSNQWQIRLSCRAYKDWVFRSRDLRRGTEPQMSLKGRSPQTSKVELKLFYTFSAFWGPRLSKLSANPYGSLGVALLPRILADFLF